MCDFRVRSLATMALVCAREILGAGPLRPMDKVRVRPVFHAAAAILMGDFGDFGVLGVLGVLGVDDDGVFVVLKGVTGGVAILGNGSVFKNVGCVFVFSEERFDAIRVDLRDADGTPMEGKDVDDPKGIV